MRRTALRGHALRHEGKPFRRGGRTGCDWIRYYGSDGRGVGLCECGATSPGLGTDAARKAWHGQHKDEVRTKEGTPGAR